MMRRIKELNAKIKNQRAELNDTVQRLGGWLKVATDVGIFVLVMAMTAGFVIVFLRMLAMQKP